MASSATGAAGKPGWPLAGGVIAELILAHLKPDQMLERGAGNRGTDTWFAQRINGRIGVARASLASKDAPHIFGKRGGRSRHPNRRLGPRLGAIGAGREVQGDLPDALGNNLAPALNRRVEIRQDHLAGLAGIAAYGKNVESGG